MSAYRQVMVDLSIFRRDNRVQGGLLLIAVMVASDLTVDML